MVALLSIWNIVFANELHKGKDISMGYGSPDDEEPKYFEQNRRAFVAENYFNGIVLCSIFFYFYYVCNTYSKVKNISCSCAMCGM